MRSKKREKGTLAEIVDHHRQFTLAVDGPKRNCPLLAAAKKKTEVVATFELTSTPRSKGYSNLRQSFFLFTEKYKDTTSPQRDAEISRLWHLLIEDYRES